VFTSGATEAINLAIKGVAENYQSKGKHIVTVATEHSAVLDTCKYLETKGFEVTYLPVKADGLIDFEVFQNSLRTDTILISVMHVNNETGVIQDIKTISELSHQNGSIFMTDATQSIGKIPMDVDEYGIDLMCFSGHKIYGPKGVGALYIRQQNPGKIKIPALVHGGGHERGLRSGTLNVPGIVALGKACELGQNEMKGNSKYIGTMRDELEKELLKMEGTFVNGSFANRLFNVTNITFQGVDSEALILLLGQSTSKAPMIAVSNGSACTSASIEPSHVLISMGLSRENAFSSLRFSFGVHNQVSEIDFLVSKLKNILAFISY
jgi:cysteine desulfurase